MLDPAKRFVIDCLRCPGKMAKSAIPRWGRALFMIGFALLVFGGLAVSAAGVLMLRMIWANTATGVLVGGSGVLVVMVASIPVFIAGLVLASRKSVWCCAECDTVIERA